LIIANKLKISEDESKLITSAAELPGIDADFEILFAIVFQNLLQPKNNHRKDAVANKTYKEILNQADSRNFLTANLTSSL